MVDIFEQKNIRPMLISEMREAFDDPDFIYELKLDGERCVAYLDKNGTTLQNKRNLILNARYPELTQIHKTVKTRCILDGELAILVNGKPAFSEIQRRSLLTNQFKIELSSQKSPACFTAFDILYYKDKPVMDLPLMKRKQLLETAVWENGVLAISRYIEEKGVEFYSLAAAQNLEGIVAKRKDSFYYPGKRTKEWIKIKNLQDDDFVVCGYVKKDNHVASIVLGQYEGKVLRYKGHVTLGVSREDFRRIQQMPLVDSSPFHKQDDENTVWICPALVCTVKYMEKTASGMLRQPAFKGLREDKAPKDCRNREQ